MKRADESIQSRIKRLAELGIKPSERYKIRPEQYPSTPGNKRYEADRKKTGR